MDVLVFGGTRYFGVHLVNELIKKGYHVTIATRGMTPDSFGTSVERIHVDRYDTNQLKDIFKDKEFDIVYDNLAYSSQDIETLFNSLHCHRYILTSSNAVYPFQLNTKEDDFIAAHHVLKMGVRSSFSYDEGKRQAESAIVQLHPQQKTTRVRFPVVLGRDDYTKRLYFYVEHIFKGVPMYIDEFTTSFNFISSPDAGAFLAYLSDKDIFEAINACSPQSITLQEIFDYIEDHTGKKAIITSDGDKAPFNDIQSHSLNVKKAQDIGFHFTPLSDWLFPLIDFYICQVSKDEHNI